MAKENFPIVFKGYEFEPDLCGVDEAPGVYMITRTNMNSLETEVMYIGSSRNMRKRINTPSHPYRYLFDKEIDHFVSASCVRVENYLELEKEMIKHFNPPLNITYTVKTWHRGI